MCVRARGLCGERWQMLPGQNRGSKCTAAAAAARISTVLSRLLSRCCLRCLRFVSVLSRFCLGVVSPLLPQTPYHPTGGVIGTSILSIYIERESTSACEKKALKSGKHKTYQEIERQAFKSEACRVKSADPVTQPWAYGARTSTH